MKQLNKIYFFYFVFFVVILKFFNAPYNSYYILKSPYKERMTTAYGLCNNESWGFYNIIANNYDLKNKTVRIINSAGNVLIDPLFPSIKNSDDKQSQFLMVLNFINTNDQDIFNSKIENIDKYFIKYRYGNCYLLELND